MPLYDFKCLNCETIYKDVFKRMQAPTPNCAFCNMPVQNISYAYVKKPWDTDGIVEHVADTPMRFKTARELKAYCRDHGMTATGVEGSI